EAAVAAQGTALINIEVETGLNRLGVPLRALPSLLQRIQRAQRSAMLVGISTHLSSAEDVASQHIVDTQFAALEEARALCHTYGIEVPFVHAANSAATIFARHVQGTMVRAGIALYGLWPSRDIKIAVQRGRACELTPVLSWKARIAQVKDVPAGGGIGYDRTFIANRPMRIAVLPVGYYDGFDRGLSNGGKVLVHGRPCPVVGRVCMNMAMVDVSAIAQVKPDDVATIIGREGIGTVSAEEIAEKLATINYEVVTRISAHLPRVVV
ncbi:alanine racemase, partial [Candidatus Uhrbacteria bacterium]|nr:alanine racemase [Candidatus Uhrbacteria bacterium]